MLDTKLNVIILAQLEVIFDAIIWAQLNAFFYTKFHPVIRAQLDDIFDTELDAVVLAAQLGNFSLAICHTYLS